MWQWLRYDKGYQINHKRVERLYYEVMCLRSLLPGKHTTKRNKSHPVYPYLLGDLKVERANQVWQTDISYIPMASGFMYLSAIIDVHTRYVVLSVYLKGVYRVSVSRCPNQTEYGR